MEVMPCRSLETDSRCCARVGGFWVCCSRRLWLLLCLIPRGHCAGGKTDQAHRETHSGFHGRLQGHGEALRERQSGQTGPEGGGAGRGCRQEERLCEPRRI